MTPAQEAAAQTCLSECHGHIARGEHEATIRSVFNSHLRGVAGTPLPWWAREHFVKTEAALRATRAGRAVTGFADNLVGLTAIEYEKNLASAPVFAEGLRQVHEYVAGLLNSGAPHQSVRGVLSDTVRWYAYEVDSIALTATPGRLAGTDVTLRPASVLPTFDGSAADLPAARQLHQFLELHLGRDAGQVLSAGTLRDMLGLESDAGRRFLASAEAVIDSAFAADPAYAAMVQGLWANFVSFVGTTGAQAGRFDKQAYVCELYLLTVAKLVAANVLQGHALVSSAPQLQEILDGRHFRAQGLTNLVEYDYFGWLTKAPHIGALVQLAEDIQRALKAFDFSFLQAEDLFGQLVTQLAERTQRLLLGQEPTPGWLVSKIVDAVEAGWPGDENWRFVDPCCGSGAFVVEVVARQSRRPGFTALTREQRGQELGQVIAGFDVDPLAVMLAKVSWLVAAKPALQPFNSGFPVSIPIYHADSLFALTPLARTVFMNAAGDFDLNLDGQRVALPGFLASPDMQGFFDEFMDSLYRAGQAYANLNPPVAVAPAEVQHILTSASTSTGTTLSAAQGALSEAFGQQFVRVLADLERRGRNGLWLHMLKNGYRPALVRGKFNGVVTNFPWLALSKLADNPYKAVLQAKTEEFGLQPVPQSALHLELATIFLVHAAKHYLGERGRLAAVVPNSVIQGTQHEPLRSGNFRLGRDGVPLQFVEVWDADRATFGSTNVAAVLVAEKGVPEPPTLHGRYVSEGSPDVTYPLYLSTLNNRNAWTKIRVNMANAGNFDFRQGADIMPRTVWLHEVAVVPGPGGTTRFSIAPIAGANSPFHHLVNNAKACRDFRAVPTTVASNWGFELLTSTHLLQFLVNSPALAILPMQHRRVGAPAIQPAGVATMASDASASAHFQRVFAALSQDDGWGVAGVDTNLVFRRLNVRNKLTQQQFSAGDTLVLFGAGGGYPAAAKMQVTAQNAAQLVVDQTLYWMVVNNLDQADYLVGLINSARLAETIRPFQPVGMNGPRHVHELPLAVIPTWDPSDARHINVVSMTRALAAEMATAIAASPALQRLVGTPSNVARRRSELRNAIAALPSYPAYETACSLVV
jgi:hypothetical protein